MAKVTVGSENGTAIEIRTGVRWAHADELDDVLLTLESRAAR